MTIDHLNRIYSFGIASEIIGRLSMPLFAWGIAKGIVRSGDIRKYIFRLLMLAIVSQVPYWYFFQSHQLNICFTLLDGLIILTIIRSDYNWILNMEYIAYQ